MKKALKDITIGDKIKLNNPKCYGVMFAKHEPLLSGHIAINIEIVCVDSSMHYSDSIIENTPDFEIEMYESNNFSPSESPSNSKIRLLNLQDLRQFVHSTKEWDGNILLFSPLLGDDEGEYGITYIKQMILAENFCGEKVAYSAVKHTRFKSKILAENFCGEKVAYSAVKHTRFKSKIPALILGSS